jgi:hypothetical protein
MTQPEFSISGDQVRRALADEATASLPDGELKLLLSWLTRTMDTEYTRNATELVVRYPRPDAADGPRTRLA